jgi:hypothetical protein
MHQDHLMCPFWSCLNEPGDYPWFGRTPGNRHSGGKSVAQSGSVSGSLLAVRVEGCCLAVSATKNCCWNNSTCSQQNDYKNLKLHQDAIPNRPEIYLFVVMAGLLFSITRTSHLSHLFDASLFLEEIQEQLLEARNVEVLIATLSRSLHRLAIMHKQTSKAAAEAKRVAAQCVRHLSPRFCLLSALHHSKRQQELKKNCEGCGCFFSQELYKTIRSVRAYTVERYC